MIFPQEVLETLVSCFPHLTPDRSEPTKVLSHRRNKGLLTVCGSEVVREINLEFFNSGSNDGVPSSVIREVALLRGKLCGHPHIVCLNSVSSPSYEIVRLSYPFLRYNLREFIACTFAEQAVVTGTVGEIAHQIFRGLAFMHASGVMHRNVRPENLLVEAEGSVLTVKLTDLSQARYVAIQPEQPMTHDEVRNRPMTNKEEKRLVYRSPELLIRTKTYGPATDVWSAAVVLMELCMHPSPLQWGSCQTESECLMQLCRYFGTPTDWPDLDLSCLFWHWELPRCTACDAIWTPIVLNHGVHAPNLLKAALRVNPAERPSAESCLSCPFVTGSLQDSLHAFSSNQNFFVPQAPVTAVPTGLTTANHTEWVGSFLFKLAKIIDCPTSHPVHVAVRMFSATNWDNPAVGLAACLKMATRFLFSKDTFKQVTSQEIAKATGLAVSDLVQAERRILTSQMTEMIEFFDTTIIECIASLAASSPVANYLADLCLLDKDVFDFFPSHLLAAACCAVASQWTATDSLVLDRFSHTVESLQLCMARVISLVTDTRTTLYALENGLVMQIIEFNYRRNGKSLIPSTLPSGGWNTSRSYVASLLGNSDTPALPQTPRQPLSETPAKPLVRSSTIQHAQEWAIHSRRRSRVSLVSTAKKRSRSATPAPIANTKRICQVDARRFFSADQENVIPSNEVVRTPVKPIRPNVALRRSARLRQRQESIN